ncbi:MAG TPA: cytochrome c peroxidase [Bacteroidales bacterium]|nr:cytochrome c peroxidase [Bacteroidales bacterium]
MGNLIVMRPCIYLAILLILFQSCNFNSRDQNADNNVREDITSAEESFTLKEKLGKLLFFETALSDPAGQACVSCHNPSVAFADPDTGLPVSKGARKGLYGNRNDMPVSYSMFVPPLYFDEEEGIWIGGLFWDGRANTLAEQSMGPPVNPLEMANTDAASVAGKLRSLDYADLFYEIYGADALKEPHVAFNNMADAIEAYEKTSEVNPFNSKYDYYLRGEAELSDQEMRGLALFVTEQKGNCIACHPNTISENGTPPLFTDYSYDNLGVPKNPENPFYLLPSEFNPDGPSFVDLGLGSTVDEPAENGKFRVPTLRNVAVTSPYMHNGVFKTLFQVIAFYNTRDILDWPLPEVPENVNMKEFGDLGLTNREMEDLVAFLTTLTDHWQEK